MMKCDVTSVGANIRTFTTATYSTAVQTTSLETLRAVDQTVDALATEQSLFGDFVIAAHSLIDAITECEGTDELDSDDKINDDLEIVEDALSRKYADYLIRIECARKDGELFGDHEDSVVDEYSKTLESIRSVHDVTQELRMHVREFDADLSPVDGEFSDSGGLVAHLKAV